MYSYCVDVLETVSQTDLSLSKLISVLKIVKCCVNHTYDLIFILDHRKPFQQCYPCICNNEIIVVFEAARIFWGNSERL